MNWFAFFLGRHLPSEEFHKSIRNLDSCFSLASFNISDNQTINSRNIFSFKVAGQIYHKINLAAHPSQTTEGEIEPPSYGQMYFLDPNEAVEERLKHPLNYEISHSLMHLLEELLKESKDYTKVMK